MPQWEFNAQWADNAYLYNHLLDAALRARPTPHQSNFFVKGAAMTCAGRIVTGGNHEYSVTRAIHCEETLVARALEEAGEGDPIKYLAFACGEPDSIAMPCGNCRDVLKQYASPDAVIIQGAEQGGNASATPMNAYFKEDFQELAPIGHLTMAEEFGLSDAIKAARKSYALYTKPEKVYGAVLLGGGYDSTSVAAGGLETDVAYHPTLPLRNAISQLIYMDGDPTRLRVHLAIVARIGGMPSVPYLERQHLNEFVARVNAAEGNDKPMTVWLAQTSLEGKMERLWVTDSDEWLPHPFSPKVLRIGSALKDSIEKAR